MKKETSMKVLGIFSWFYIIACIFYGGLAIFMFTQQNNQMIQEILSKAEMPEVEGFAPATLMGIVFTVAFITNALEAWLLRRASKDGKKSTLLIVIVIISIIGQVMNLIKAFNVSNLVSISISLFILYILFNGRKEEN